MAHDPIGEVIDSFVAVLSAPYWTEECYTSDLAYAEYYQQVETLRRLLRVIAETVIQDCVNLLEQTDGETGGVNVPISKHVNEIKDYFKLK